MKKEKEEEKRRRSWFKKKGVKECKPFKVSTTLFLHLQHLLRSWTLLSYKQSSSSSVGNYNDPNSRHNRLIAYHEHLSDVHRSIRIPIPFNLPLLFGTTRYTINPISKQLNAIQSFSTVWLHGILRDLVLCLSLFKKRTNARTDEAKWGKNEKLQRKRRDNLMLIHQ